LGALLLKEQFHWKSGMGVVIAFSGTFFIVDTPESIGNPWGLVLGLIGAIGWALYNLELKHLGKFDIFGLLGMLCLLGALELFIISLCVEQGQLYAVTHASTAAVIAILYNAIGGTIIAQTLW